MTVGDPYYDPDDQDVEACMSCMEQPATLNGLCWFCADDEEYPR